MTNVSVIYPLEGSPPAELETRLQRSALTLTERATELTVTDQDGYDAGVALVGIVKELRTKAEEHHRPVIDAAHKTWKAALEALNRIDEPLKKAEALIKGKLSIWTIEQERIRQERERQAREEAERQAAALLEKQLEEMEAQGASAETVAAVVEQAKYEPIAAPVVAPTFQQASGVSVRKTYKAECTNIIELAGYIARNPQYGNLIEAKQSALNALARAQGAALRIPGVRVIEDVSMAVRR